MKRFSHSMQGVTLLEIMLVLAVAAMIIVMSVRYYQSANASSQANQVLQKIQAITASADSLAQGTGTYTDVDDTKIKALLSNVGGLTVPWGPASIGVAGGTTSYTVTIPGPPEAVCGLIWGRLQGDTHFKVTTACTAGGDLVYTYTANPTGT